MQSLTPCVKTGSLQSGGLVQSVPFEELFSENGSPDLYEEVSTSGKSCQNENAMAAVEYPPRDDYHEQPYPVMDTEGNVIGLTDLECDEELLPISWDWDANLDIEGGGGVDGLLDTPYHFNPHTDYFYTFDEYLLSTPPAIFPVYSTSVFVMILMCLFK